ncbi:terminase large subunit domain-containing protein [Acidovorax sp.]|uniref:terminase large subunit domain-containing protein n=1 Tax=Acidovorax sp. TaxID=1872122 RepID=UPI00391F71A1
MGTRKFKLLPHQVRFINDTQHRIVGLVGGFRAGKTYAAVHKGIDLAFRNPGLDGALMEPTQSMIRGTLMPVVNKVLKDDYGWTEGKQYTYRKSNPESLVIHFPEGDTTIFLCGAENYHRLAGKTLAWFGIDEIDRCTSRDVALAAFKEATARLTRGPCVQGFVTTTPEGFHFSHLYFVENERDESGTVRPDRYLHKAKTFDNPYVPSTYITSIRSNYTAKQAEAYLNGEFVNLASGNVYYAFDRALNCTTKTLQDFQKTVLYVGMDFNNDHMSAVVCAHDQLSGHTYVVEEIVDEKNTESMIRRLKADYGHWAQHANGITIYPDSSGKNASANASLSSIAMLKQAGFKCEFKGNNPSIMKERVPAVNAQFSSQKQVNGEWVAQQKLFVNIEKCPVLVKGLEQQGFGPDGKPDKTTGLDHCLDALGYFIAFMFPVPGKGSVSVLR